MIATKPIVQTAHRTIWCQQPERQDRRHRGDQAEQRRERERRVAVDHRVVAEHAQPHDAGPGRRDGARAIRPAVHGEQAQGRERELDPQHDEVHPHVRRIVVRLDRQGAEQEGEQHPDRHGQACTREPLEPERVLLARIHAETPKQRRYHGRGARRTAHSRPRAARRHPRPARAVDGRSRACQANRAAPARGSTGDPGTNRSAMPVAHPRGSAATGASPMRGRAGRAARRRMRARPSGRSRPAIPSVPERLRTRPVCPSSRVL